MRRKRPSRPTLKQVGLDNPMQAVPTLAEGVESKADSAERLHVRRRMSPKPGATSWFARILGQRFEVRVSLDEVGGFCFARIDGRRSLGQIADDVAGRFELEDGPCRESVVRYVRMLMDRKLVYLEVPPEDSSPGEDP